MSSLEVTLSHYIHIYIYIYREREREREKERESNHGDYILYIILHILYIIYCIYIYKYICFYLKFPQVKSMIKYEKYAYKYCFSIFFLFPIKIFLKQK